MRKEIILNGGWRFHKGDIAEPISQDKGFIYSQSKTERKMYMGKIRVAVKPKKGQESFTLTAMSDNCGVCELKVVL